MSGEPATLAPERLGAARPLLAAVAEALGGPAWLVGGAVRDALLGRPVAKRFKTRFCGNGVLATCRDSLWSALDAAAAVLEQEQGPAPSSWRSDATLERIRFVSGVLPDTMRWTNRPTFQQVVTFSGHRPRR